ncbi:MAG: hypothetical protein JO166_13250 [Deltaproteobacteria bacterium]|nr:hypothetical protein [Deltaproteobacteria bacterium]
MAESATANGTAESFSRMTEAFFNTDLRRVAALYLDFIENMTKQILDCQETATGWAKETPLEPFIEFQTSITRKLAETSISAVRSFYQLQPAS